jgi:hypothetical protein
MDDQPNPYEPPQEECPPAPMPYAPVQNDGWKFVVLGIVILCGLASYMPGFAFLFAVLSSPVFIRYAIQVQRRKTGWIPHYSAIAEFLGGAGLVLGILAALAGAFLGSCTVATWSAIFTSDIILGPSGYERDLQIALPIGVVVGAIAFLTSAIWLARRSWSS